MRTLHNHTCSRTAATLTLRRPLRPRHSARRQQVMFIEQLYDLHRAIAIQKLLMQNCPEVQQVHSRRGAAVLSSCAGRRGARVVRRTVWWAAHAEFLS